MKIDFLSRESVNAFSPEYRREYGRLFDVLTEAHASETDARVVVLSLAFPKIFSAGLDYECAPPSVTPNLIVLRIELRLVSRRTYIRHIASLREGAIWCGANLSSKPCAARRRLAVDLIVACDVRYVASNTSFSIKACEVDIGRAPELTQTGRVFSADEAEKLGLLSKLVEGGHEAVIAAALDLAQAIAEKSPVAVAGAKHLITRTRDHKCCREPCIHRDVKCGGHRNEGHLRESACDACERAPQMFGLRGPFQVVAVESTRLQRCQPLRAAASLLICATTSVSSYLRS
ncbi:putative enoyl-CoA hydratase/isomerase [Lyophyllum shimeji]|uniref:Enoyl-CoA hydratase/isomerase n=1 Tax=Lyophyllum shimeji TaxID=47721 RepID=A0A9P3Q2F5_LYOSH|nr:putative enoyl-CoA hydratase/isomerase [Lyophyllum shimeji]